MYSYISESTNVLKKLDIINQLHLRVWDRIEATPRLPFIYNMSRYCYIFITPGQVEFHLKLRNKIINQTGFWLNHPWQETQILVIFPKKGTRWTRKRLKPIRNCRKFELTSNCMSYYHETSMKHKQYSHDNHILCSWSFTVLKYTSAALCRRKSSQEWVSLQDMSGPVRTKRESTISTHIFTLKRIFPSFSNFPSWWLNQPH